MRRHGGPLLSHPRQTASFVVHVTQVNINGFSEQDQENLYNATRAGKSAGKKGLGKSSQGKPIGGAKWEGSKTVLDQEEEQADAAAAASISKPDVQKVIDTQGVHAALYASDAWHGHVAGILHVCPCIRPVSRSTVEQWTASRMRQQSNYMIVPSALLKAVTSNQLCTSC